MFVMTVYHGHSGPLSVIQGGFTPWARAFVKAGVELGYNITDHNGKTQDGKLWEYI